VNCGWQARLVRDLSRHISDKSCLVDRIISGFGCDGTPHQTISMNLIVLPRPKFFLSQRNLKANYFITAAINVTSAVVSISLPTFTPLSRSPAKQKNIKIRNGGHAGRSWSCTLGTPFADRNRPEKPEHQQNQASEAEIHGNWTSSVQRLEC